VGVQLESDCSDMYMWEASSVRPFSLSLSCTLLACTFCVVCVSFERASAERVVIEMVCAK
jgi:uncharacterized membrane protein